MKNFVEKKGIKKIFLVREAFKNKPKGLKVAKEVLMSIGSMVDSLDDQ